MHERINKNQAFVLVEKMEHDLVRKGFIESMTFERISSPKYYNFENDSIHVTIVPKVEAIKTYILEHYEEFDDYVKRKYTSYDGFTSFYPNTAFQWSIDTNIFTNLHESSHTLGCLLDFIMTNEGEDDNDYISIVDECINFDEYCEITQIELNDIEFFDIRVNLIRDNIDDIDLEHGYLRVLSEEARAKSILLGTDFIEELVEVAYSELVDALPFNHVDSQLRPIYN